MNRDSIKEQAAARAEYTRRIEKAVVPIIGEYQRLTARKVAGVDVTVQNKTMEDGSLVIVATMGYIRHDHSLEDEP